MPNFNIKVSGLKTILNPFNSVTVGHNLNQILGKLDARLFFQSLMYCDDDYMCLTVHSEGPKLRGQRAFKIIHSSVKCDAKVNILPYTRQVPDH